MLGSSTEERCSVRGLPSTRSRVEKKVQLDLINLVFELVAFSIEVVGFPELRLLRSLLIALVSVVDIYPSISVVRCRNVARNRSGSSSCT